MFADAVTDSLVPLTPGFSRVAERRKPASRFNGLPPVGKTVETVFSVRRALHRAEARC
jgi:hypothetical protein